MTRYGWSQLRSLSRSGKATNEDLFGVAGDYAWVLDGATGHRDQPITSGETDGQWFVEQLDEAFREFSHGASGLPELGRRAIERVRERFLTVAPDTLDRGLDVPAAAGILVRRVAVEGGPDETEYLVLGDCTLLIEKEHTVVRMSDNRGGPKEQEQIEAMQREFEDGVEDPWKARERARDVFLTNKSRINSPGNYWVFSLEPDAVDEALTGRFRSTDGTVLHLMTDGFSSLIDTYHVYETWEEAIDAVERDGVESVVDEIRAAERADEKLRTYPRTKPSDDATLLSITPESGP